MSNVKHCTASPINDFEGFLHIFYCRIKNFTESLTEKLAQHDHEQLGIRLFQTLYKYCTYMQWKKPLLANSPKARREQIWRVHLCKNSTIQWPNIMRQVPIILHCGVHVTHSLVFYVVFWDHCSSFYPLSFAIVVLTMSTDPLDQD
jgi:hypothetical protein